MSVRGRGAWVALAQAVRQQRRPGSPPITTQLGAFPRMVSEAVNGEYPHLPGAKLAMMGLALAYVVSPVDLMPEAILGVFGLADDGLLVAWLAGAALAETDAYLQWRQRPVTAPENPDTHPGTPPDAAA